MAEQTDPGKLELRIKELENQLKELKSARQLPEVSQEELQTYLKVRGQLAELDPSCGINECQRCIVLRCAGRCIVVRCLSCIVECTCGPLGGGGHGGLERFSGLGG